jgi:hypothetical protein
LTNPGAESAIALFVDAVRRSDGPAIHAAVDWPVSGVAEFVRSVWALEPAERAAIARSGVANLLTEGTETPISMGWLRSCSGGDVQVRPATTQEMRTIRARLLAAGLPPEVDDDVLTAVRALLQAARTVQEIAILECNGSTVCGLAAGGSIEGVAIIRQPEDGTE